MFRYMILTLLVVMLVPNVYGQEVQSRRFGVVSLREILKQVPLAELAVHCKTNDWGDAYGRASARLYDLNRRLEKCEDAKLEQHLRDQKYRVEQERSQLEGNMRPLQESIVRQYIADNFAEDFHAILNSDDSFEAIHLGLESVDITNVVISRLRTREAEKSIR